MVKGGIEKAVYEHLLVEDTRTDGTGWSRVPESVFKCGFIKKGRTSGRNCYSMCPTTNTLEKMFYSTLISFGYIDCTLTILNSLVRHTSSWNFISRLFLS